MNPITGHLLNLVQHKQQAEAAKLALLAQLLAKGEAILGELETVNVHLTEILERAKAK